MSLALFDERILALYHHRTFLGYESERRRHWVATILYLRSLVLLHPPITRKESSETNMCYKYAFSFSLSNPSQIFAKPCHLLVLSYSFSRSSSCACLINICICIAFFVPIRKLMSKIGYTQNANASCC
jgi:hypothetical protein